LFAEWNALSSPRHKPASENREIAVETGLAIDPLAAASVLSTMHEVRADRPRDLIVVGISASHRGRVFSRAQLWTACVGLNHQGLRANTVNTTLTVCVTNRKPIPADRAMCKRVGCWLQVPGADYGL